MFLFKTSLEFSVNSKEIITFKHLMRDALSFFTDGSKLRGEIGEDKELSVKNSFRLLEHLSIVIKVSVDVLLRSAASFGEVSIHSISKGSRQY